MGDHRVALQLIMQITIINGEYTDASGEIRNAYPVNLVPVPKVQGISRGYLKPAEGILLKGSGPGIDRGGINWDGVLHRVMGSKLVRIDSNYNLTVLGDVGAETTPVTLHYSFDRLAIAAGTRLYYWNGAVLSQVTDIDLGVVVDMIWIDGYFMTTDGTSLIVTDLGNPMSVNPLKYGSSEIDPDRVVGLLGLYNEVYALNRYTTEIFQNVGGSLFPFARVPGAQIRKGCVGTYAKCILDDSICFVGSGRNEPIAIYVARNSESLRISSRDIEQTLAGYTEAELSMIKIEAKYNEAQHHLLVHLADRTLVYDVTASKATEQPVWHQLTTNLSDFSAYRGRNLVWVYDAWQCGDPSSPQYGTLSGVESNHYGLPVRWEFSVPIIYNDSRGAIVHSLELVSLTGLEAPALSRPSMSTAYSNDGIVFSQEKSIATSVAGERGKRLVWRQQGFFRNFRIQRFRGDSFSKLTFIRLEAEIEPLGA